MELQGRLTQSPTLLGGRGWAIRRFIRGEGKLVVGLGPVRTGVTAIAPRGRRDGASVFAGYFALNG